MITRVHVHLTFTTPISCTYHPPTTDGATDDGSPLPDLPAWYELDLGRDVTVYVPVDIMLTLRDALRVGEFQRVHRGDGAIDSLSPRV